MELIVYPVVKEGLLSACGVRILEKIEVKKSATGCVVRFHRWVDGRVQCAVGRGKGSVISQKMWESLKMRSQDRCAAVSFGLIDKREVLLAVSDSSLAPFIIFM